MPFTIHTGGSGPRRMTENTPGRYGARPLTANEARGAVVFLVLFGLPFAAGGVWVLTLLPRRWASGDGAGTLVLAAAGLAFALVGFGLMAASLVGRQKLQLEAKSAWVHPDEPWKWRPDWAEGHVLDGGKNIALGMVLFAVLWNLIAFPGGWLAWVQGSQQGQPWAPIALLFPAAGCGLAAWAIRGVVRVRRFGASRFDLDAVPIPVGRTLSGTIRTRLATPPEGGFALTLSALRITRSGPDNDTSTRIVWQEEAQVEGRLSSDADGTRVVFPVAIRIPSDAPSTDHRAADDELVWRLEVKAAQPGIDYLATFELPIYRTDESDLPERAQDASHLRAVAPLADAPRPEPRSAIALTRTGDGLVIDFPAARNPSMASGLTLFGVVWTASIVFMTRVHAPLLFPIVFGLFDVLIVWIALTLWFGVTRLRVTPTGVSLASGLGAPGAEKIYTGIRDVRIAIGMTSNTTAYYDLKLVRADGREVTAGGGIRHKREAEWLAAQVRAALGQPRRA